MIEQMGARAISFLLLNWQVMVGVIVLLLVGSGLLQDLRAREKILQNRLEGMQESLQKDMTDIRVLTEEQSQRDREVFQVGLYNFNESVSRIMGEMNRTQQGQFDTFGGQLHAATRVTEEQLERIQGLFDERVGRFTDVLNESMGVQGQRLEDVSQRLEQTLTQSERRFETLQGALERNLQQMRQHNDQRMQQLQIQPDQHLMSVCSGVSAQLDQVARGLGELQVMAGGAADVRKVLDHLKLRGTWAEVRAEELLDSALSVSQYRAKIAVRPQSQEIADFAVILPGKGEEGEQAVYLPIDTSFPYEEHDRLVRAIERREEEEIQTATKALELALRVQAKRMRDAYVDPPFTTDYAILYLPTEGLYAQMVQDSKFREQLQQQYRVLLSGPSTMAALLGSLQSGLRAHTMEHRAKELRQALNDARERMEALRGILGTAQAEADANGAPSMAAERISPANSMFAEPELGYEPEPEYEPEQMIAQEPTIEPEIAPAPQPQFVAQGVVGEDEEEEHDLDEWD